MGKLTISMAIFYVANCKRLPGRVLRYNLSSPHVSVEKKSTLLLIIDDSNPHINISWLRKKQGQSSINPNDFRHDETRVKSSTNWVGKIPQLIS